MPGDTGRYPRLQPDKRIFEMWLACWTQEEIAEREGITQQAIDLVLQETASLPKLVKPTLAAAEHVTDFEPPIFFMPSGALAADRSARLARKTA